MVRSCAAFNCNSKNGSKDEDRNNITCHRFPLTDDFINRKWIAATRRENFQPTADHLLCSLHFEENCYMENYVNRRQLKDDAIPTVFGFATHLKKVTKARKPRKPKPRNVETAENVFVDVHVSGYTGDHNYSFPSSPSKLKEKFEKIEEREEAKIGQCMLMLAKTTTPYRCSRRVKTPRNVKGVTNKYKGTITTGEATIPICRFNCCRRSQRDHAKHITNSSRN
ncbi:THAP domain-containing protein 1 B-like [Schistocerca americana]|uniref:THAP domain-containing protein 1 B-like n=1 Tax=Schistocerca americana TaxID=7009 RepID=UPI001F4FBC06|nr:THAP domain-containing protein 1 B-like [Schistocerca americana]